MTVSTGSRVPQAGDRSFRTGKGKTSGSGSPRIADRALDTPPDILVSKEDPEKPAPPPGAAGQSGGHRTGPAESHRQRVSSPRPGFLSRVFARLHKSGPPRFPGKRQNDPGTGNKESAWKPEGDREEGNHPGLEGVAPGSGLIPLGWSQVPDEPTYRQEFPCGKPAVPDPYFRFPGTSKTTQNRTIIAPARVLSRHWRAGGLNIPILGV